MQGLFELFMYGFLLFCLVWFLKGKGKRHDAKTRKSRIKCTEVSIHKDMQFFNTGGKILVTRECSRGDSTEKAWGDSTGDLLQKV